MNTSLAEYRRLAAEHDLVPVCRELLADLDTPVSVLSRFAECPNAFLLESIEGGETWGRYSFIGVDPQLLLEVDHAQSSGAALTQGLRAIYQGLRVATPPGLPRFFGGAVGFIAYEAVGDMEKLPLPKTLNSSIRAVSRFLKVDKLVVFDNLRHTLKIIVCSRPAAAPGGWEQAYAQAQAQIEEVAEILGRPAPSAATKVYPAVEFHSNMSADQYRQMVLRAKQYISSGAVIQTVLSQRFSAQTNVAPLQLYRALRLLNPSPYMYFLKIGQQALVGSSPEIMVRLTGRRIELRPIAGTRPRGATESEDRRLADSLLSDEKEKAEHVMLVDLGRNDVGRVAQTGSVQVRDYLTLERYSHVMHIVSHVEGMLRDGADALDVIRATFPAGTLSGAPKVRAMEIIHELEPEPRGAYGGALGYISYSGSMDFAITIRTLEIAAGRVAVQAGAGIVYNSDPQKEYEETCHKARGLLAAVDLAARGLRLEQAAP